MAIQRLNEVDLETAQAIFTAGGTLHMVRGGYSMHAGYTADNRSFRSLEHAITMFRSDIGCEPTLCVDAADKHTANPLAPCEAS